MVHLIILFILFIFEDPHLVPLVEFPYPHPKIQSK